MKKILNIRSFALALSAFCLMLSGCQGYDCCSSTVFDGSESSLFFDGSGGTKSVTVISSMNWKMLESPSWLTLVTPTTGSGTLSLNVTAPANTSSGSRSGNIVLLAENGDKLTIKVTQGDDPLLDFITNGTPRWETGSTVEINADHPYIYITDNGSNARKLFGSSLFKTGRITVNDGSAFEIIEFNTAPTTVGVYTGCGIYNFTNQVSPAPLDYLEVVKIDGKKLWIVFREDGSTVTRRIVQ